MALPTLDGPASKAKRKSNKEKFLALPGVQTKIDAMATKFGVPSSEILQLIEKETGGSYSAGQQNFKGGGARGLIQFLGDKGTESYKTIKGKKYEIADIAKMDELEQLDLVETFLQEGLDNAGQKKYKPGELSLAVAAPAFIGKDDKWIENWGKENPDMYKKMMKNNPGWVKDGKMNKSSITGFYTGAKASDIQTNQEASFFPFPVVLSPESLGMEQNLMEDASGSDFSGANPREQVSNAKNIIDEFKETFPDGVSYSKIGTAEDYTSKQSVYDNAANRLTSNDKKSLEKNLKDGTRAFYERFGEKGVKAFGQSDDKVRRQYLDFMKDNGYLSYTNEEGNAVNYSDQDLNTVGGVNNSRQILGHFTNTVSSEKYAEFITGEKSGLFAFDSNLENMLEDSNFNHNTIQKHFKIEETAIKNLKNKMSKNEILKDFTEDKTISLWQADLNIPEARNSFASFLNSTLHDKGGPYVFKGALEARMKEYIAENNIDTRTSPNEPIQNVIDEIHKSQTEGDPDAGKGFGDEVDLSGVEDVQKEWDEINAERISAINAGDTERVSELGKMLEDLDAEKERRDLAEDEKARELGIDESSQKTDLIEPGAYDREYIESVQSGETLIADVDLRNQILNIDTNQMGDDDVINITEDGEVSSVSSGETLDTTKPDDELKPPVEEAPETSWFKENAGALSRGAMGLLNAAIGKKELSKALEDIPVEEGHQLDGAWKAYMGKMREMSASGLSAEERASARQDLSTAYNLGVTNVMRAAGGSRAAFLANAGVLNANRVKGLLKLHATDAALQRENLANYGKALQYQQEHGRMTGEIDRRMAYNEAKRKSDIHGTIGATLIGEALKTVNYGLEQKNNKKYMEAWQDTLESKEDVLGLKKEVQETKSQYEALMKNYEKGSNLIQETNK